MAHGSRWRGGGGWVLGGAGALLTAGVALAACGGTSFSMVRAYGDTVAARTARVTITASVAIPGPGAAGATINMTGGGVTDLASRTGDLTLNVPGAGPVEERMVGGTEYTHYPSGAGSSQLPPGKTWISMNFAELCGSSSALGTAGAADPTSLLGQLRNASTSGLEDVGTARVGGVETTHYRASLDLTKAVKTQCSSGALSGVIAKEAARFHTMPVDVWVDGADRIRQMRMRLDLPVGSATAHMDMTVGFSDFGVAVNVVPPAPAETVDLTQLPGFNRAVQAAGNG